MKTKLLTALAVGFFLQTVAEARVAPSFNGELIGGGRVSLQSALKKDKALLLMFWASWCVPCIQELKSVSAKLKAEPSLPLEVLSVNVDTQETSSAVKPAIRQNQLEFPVIVDPQQAIFSMYFNAKTLPFSVLIDGSGDIKATFNGYQETMFDQVKALVAKKE